ncbi:glutaminyl-tRNA synthetase [Phellopilus nigrolimitatus]|nr:glutaminyl-tRNA synthetase [Phellopilus nigrolimitatus]
MPLKFDLNDPEVSKLIDLFQTIGFTKAKATETAKSTKNASALKEIIEKNNLSERSVDDKKASLISGLAVQGSNLGKAEKSYIVDAILDERLKSAEQVSAAVKFAEAKGFPTNSEEFNKECGVGFSITPEELYTRATNYVSSASVSGWTNLSTTISALKGTSDLRWANPLELKNAVEKAFTAAFGEKTAIKAKGAEGKPKKASSDLTSANAGSSSAASSSRSVFDEGFLGKLHKPGENPQIHPRLRDAHLAATGGIVYTRFPPEPNGYLHIGHSKAIFINFGYAAHHGGKCYLRYDDTNPEAEEARYFESILEIIRWLGFEPWKITYSSDYFQELYDLAVELIKRDKGYICHCTGEEIHEMRGGDDGGPRRACSHRDRPISESLAEFQKMKDGHYKPGQGILRMKQNLEDGNPQMWDLIAYRVLYASHHRTGDKWKIYPTYDFTHCLVDSFENISHSLCTTEFILSRVSYEWLCDVLEVYKPRQSEYGRLNVTGTIMSKRKILALVKEGYVRGWDDPRLYTLIALRRRGIPPGAILSFVSTLGVSTSTTNIQTVRFEQTVRQYLENSVPRLLMVLKPLKVTIENLPEEYLLMIEKPLHPKIPALGTTVVPFTRTVYIDADDFRLQDSKDFFRLAPGKTVGLFQAPHPITCTSFKTDPATGEVVELLCRLENSGEVKKPKAFIQWVAEHAPSGSPVRVDETRIFHQLFKSDNPSAVKPDFKADINTNSLEIIEGAMLEVGFWSLAKQAIIEAKDEGKARTKKALENEDIASPTDAQSPVPTTEQLIGNECVRFQGLRIAYFALDSDAKVASFGEENNVTAGRRDGDKIVINRIVSLKEDIGKGAA